MAIATLEDFMVYNEQIQSGMFEGVAQSLDGFNQASNGAIILSSKNHPGNYSYEAMFTLIAGAISRRDPTTTSDVDAVKPNQEQLIGVKTKGRVGPIDHTLDALRAIEMPLDQYAFILGQQLGQQKIEDLLNMAVAAVEAGLAGQSALNYDATVLSVPTIKTAYLVRAMAKMGDRGKSIAAWVMHSQQYYDLVGDQIADNLTGMSDKIVYGGTPATLGRPVVISDIPALVNDVASTDTYNVLGLVQGAVSVEESEASYMTSQIVMGKENLVHTTQGESAATLKLKGMAWNVGAGGSAPSNSAIATSTNWVKVATSTKDLPGVRLKVQ